MEMGFNVAVTLMGFVPGLGTLAAMAALMGQVLAPTPEIKAADVYACIEGFVTEAINTAIDTYDQEQVTMYMNALGEQWSTYLTSVKNAKEPLTAEDKAVIKTNFDAMLGNLANMKQRMINPHSRSGTLGNLVFYVTTLHLPYYKTKYDSWTTFYGGSEGSAQREQVISDMKSDLSAFQNALNLGVKEARDKFEGQLTGVEAPSSYCSGCSFCERSCKCCTYTFKFQYAPGVTYEATTGVTYDGYSREKEDLKNTVNAFHNALVTRKQSTSTINLAMINKDSVTWPGLIPKSNTPAIKYRLKTVFMGCFSNNYNCKQEMPAGHSFENYNISKIEVGGGGRVDLVRVTYRSRSGQELVQHWGNNDFGTIAIDTTTNVVTKLTYWSSKGPSDKIVDYQTKVEFVQKSGNKMSAGTEDQWGINEDFGPAYWGYYSMADDFSAWDGKVWLCGLTGESSHGDDEGKYVDMIAPTFCYMEAYT